MRVLLIEEGWHSTLDLAAALERHGARVTVLTANGSDARVRHRTVEWTSGPAIASDEFAPHLRALAASFDRVLPLTEDAMAAAWALELPNAWPRVEPWQQRLALDKHAMLAFLAARGIATPAHRSLAEARAPTVLKAAAGSGGRRVHVVRNPDELPAALVRARAFGGAWIAEELLPGPTLLAGGLFHEGAPLRLYAGEKLAQYPPLVGGAIAIRSTRDPALLDLATRALRELRWTGFASIDAKRDADGTLRLLEVNPRLWGSYAAAADAGVDLFAPFAEMLAGRPPPAELAFVEGTTSMIFPRYLNSASHRTLAGVWRALRHWLGAQGREWRDPRFVRHTIHRLRRMKALHERF